MLVLEGVDRSSTRPDPR